MSVTIARASHHIAVRTCEGGVAFALALSANALVAAGAVDLLAAAGHYLVQRLVAALAAAISAEEAIVAHARSSTALPVVAAIVGAVCQSTVSALPAEIAEALTHLSAVALARTVIGASGD